MMKVLNRKMLIDRLAGVFGHRYDFSKVVYEKGKSKVKIEIVCQKHGSFWKTSEVLYRGVGCPRCSIEAWALSKRKTQDDFIKDARNTHGDRYKYDKVRYHGKREKICIICKIHGLFWQSPQHHLDGRGCPECARSPKYTNEIFASKANRVHDGIYDYSKSVFIGSKKPIIIICKRHGEFKQQAMSHLMGNGCPKCQSSSGEKSVEKILREYGEEYETQKKFDGCLGFENGSGGKRRRLSFDFYIPSRDILIEYDGPHHFGPVSYGRNNPVTDFKKQKIRDRIKDEFALTNRLTLIRIPFHVLKEHGHAYLRDFLLARLGPKDVAKLL